ncbi:MAG: glutathione peroxidase [Eubacteriaceae bacterium]|nr:glutathione peroxidase [Eubacteriaceae bacterium]
MSIYDFKVTAQDGVEVPLSGYKGKVLLIVNTATGCGFTPQYSDLQKMYDEFHNNNFEILDFPCNQFGAQAPGTDEEIHTFCTTKYGTTFKQFSKVDVNGENAHDLFKYLTENTSFEGFDKNMMGKMLEGMLEKAVPDFHTSSDIKWNFTKFLIDKEGNIVKRFEPMTDLKEIEKAIKEII